jgi:hypothetical protein
VRAEAERRQKKMKRMKGNPQKPRERVVVGRNGSFTLSYRVLPPKKAGSIKGVAHMFGYPAYSKLRSRLDDPVIDILIFSSAPALFDARDPDEAGWLRVSPENLPEAKRFLAQAGEVFRRAKKSSLRQIAPPPAIVHDLDTLLNVWVHAREDEDIFADGFWGHHASRRP